MQPPATGEADRQQGQAGGQAGGAGQNIASVFEGLATLVG